MAYKEKVNIKSCGIILAGGTGSRMKSDLPKQFLELEGKAVLQYCIEAFDKSEADSFVIVVNDAYRNLCEDMLANTGTKKFAGFAANGSERIWSVKNGVEAVNNADYVLIHDGARPLVTPELINECIEKVRETGACVPGIEVKDTIKLVNSEGTVESTPERSRLRSIQTPQCFGIEIINSAYEAYEKELLYLKERDVSFQDNIVSVPTDDASLVELYTDVKVSVLKGDESNIKITTPLDMEVAKILLH